ncbi:MAG: [Fe-Fe] hydrogenase large subunit C-terminal domain-containing protein [Bacteroidales bacterium]
MQIIEIDHSRCTQSYACIRHCPVKAISARSSDGMPLVNHQRCIGCGSCVSVCGSAAITYESAVQDTIELLGSGQKTAAIVDPTISGEFPDITDYRKFVEMIRTLGFHYVSEVSFGVDLVARQYRELFSNFKGKYYLTANCPSVVSYVEKFQPDLTGNLAPIVNPMTAMAKVVRKAYGGDLKVVFIGPCLSAKNEARLYDDDGRVDAVLTFQGLRKMFDHFQVKEGKVEYSEFDPPIGNLGSLYPLSNGIIYASGLSEDLLTGMVITTDGKENMLQAVDEFNQSTEQIKKHFNIFYDEGCLMGPGTTDKSFKFLRRSLVVKYANKRLKKFDQKQWEKEMDTYASLDLGRTFKKNDQRLPEPDSDRVEEILKSLGKSPQQEASCNACGFRSCKEFAVAVSQELTKPEMCLTYSLKNKQDYIKTLKNNNEKLKKQQEKLIETEKALRSENQNIKLASETTSALLKNLPSAAVIVDEKLRVIESNESFVKVLGEDAKLINEVIPGLAGADLKTLLPYPIYNLFSFVLENDENVTGKDVAYGEGLLNVSIYSLKPNKIVGGVFRDMYVAEVRQEEIINRVSDAIDENLKMVQNIAFLLGEGASTTEKMLNSIIETYNKVKKP